MEDLNDYEEWSTFRLQTEMRLLMESDDYINREHSMLKGRTIRRIDEELKSREQKRERKSRV